jgi:hypothetical protein
VGAWLLLLCCCCCCSVLPPLQLPLRRAQAPGAPPRACCRPPACRPFKGIAPFGALGPEGQLQLLDAFSDATVFFSEAPISARPLFSERLVHVTLVRHPASRWLSHLLHALAINDDALYRAALQVGSVLQARARQQHGRWQRARALRLAPALCQLGGRRLLL